MKYSLTTFVSLITQLFPKHESISAVYRFTWLYVSSSLCPLALLSAPLCRRLIFICWAVSARRQRMCVDKAISCQVIIYNLKFLKKTGRTQIQKQYKTLFHHSCLHAFAEFATAGNQAIALQLLSPILIWAEALLYLRPLKKQTKNKKREAKTLPIQLKNFGWFRSSSSTVLGWAEFTHGTVPGASRSGGRIFFSFGLYLVGKRFRARSSGGKTFLCLHLFLVGKQKKQISGRLTWCKSGPHTRPMITEK